MGAPVVVIELPAGDRESPLVSTLLASCSSSVAEGRCVLASDAPEPDATAVAVVTWDGDKKLSASVTVGLKRREWRARAIDFREADAPKERWRTVGLVIAILVGEADRAARGEGDGGGSSVASDPAKNPVEKPVAPPPPPETAPSGASVERPPPPAPAPTPSREWLWIEGGAVVDPGLGDGWFRGGGWLGIALRPTASPIFARVGGRYAGAPSDRGLSLRWISASAGVGVLRSMTASVRLEGHLDGVVQQARATAVDTVTGVTDAGQRWVGGARAGVDVVWAPAGWWAIVGGLDLELLSSGTVLRIAGNERGRDASVAMGAALGARLSFR